MYNKHSCTFLQLLPWNTKFPQGLVPTSHVSSVIWDMLLFHPYSTSELFQLANIPFHNLQLLLFPGIQVRDTFRQAILSHGGNFAQLPREAVWGERDSLQHGNTCTLHQRLFLKLFLWNDLSVNEMKQIVLCFWCIRTKEW